VTEQPKVPVAVMISGRGSNMGALIAAALDSGFPAKIVSVISDKPEAARGWNTPASSASRRWRSRASEYASKAEHEAAVIAALDASGARIIALAGYMRLLVRVILCKRYAGRMINIHPSLLPAFPGLATHERALAAGCRVHGCTVHFVTEGMDEGPIIEQEACMRVEYAATRPTRLQPACLRPNTGSTRWRWRCWRAVEVRMSGDGQEPSSAG
jgi:phosphoribosylglycinamide formyltransferase-1